MLMGSIVSKMFLSSLGIPPNYYLSVVILGVLVVGFRPLVYEI